MSTSTTKSAKTYSNASNAKRAARKAAAKAYGTDEQIVKECEQDYFELSGNKHAGFSFSVIPPKEVEAPTPAPVKTIKALGLVSVSLVEKPVNPDCVIKKEVVAPTVERVRKIEKVRETKNGVTRPTAGGKCAAVWEICDAAAENYENGRVPFSAIKEQALADGLVIGNVRAEYAVWRKFNGITGRVVEPKQS